MLCRPLTVDEAVALVTARRPADARPSKPDGRPSFDVFAALLNHAESRSIRVAIPSRTGMRYDHAAAVREWTRQRRILDVRHLVAGLTRCGLPRRLLAALAASHATRPDVAGRRPARLRVVALRDTAPVPLLSARTTLAPPSRAERVPSAA